MPKEINTRISFIAFFSLLTIILSGTYYTLINNLDPVGNRVEPAIAQNVSQISTEARLQSLSHLIRYYDLLLTESARNYAYSGDEKWKQEYLYAEPILSDLINEAIQKGTVEDQELFKEIFDINQILIDIEKKSFILVEAGDTEAAIALLSGTEYTAHKNQYEIALLTFEENRSQTFLASTVDATQSLTELFNRTTQAVEEEEYLHTIIVFSLLILFSITAVAFTEKTFQPLDSIFSFTSKLSNGEWNERLETKNAGVFKQLAHNLNAVAQRAEQMTLGLQSQLASSKDALTSTTSELTKEKNIFEKVFAQSSIGMALVSLDGKFIKVNKSLYNMLGYTEEELLSKSFQDITHPDDLDEDLAYVEETIQGKRDTYSIRKRYIHKKGTSVPIKLTVTVAKNDLKEPEFFISQIQDLSEEVQ